MGAGAFAKLCMLTSSGADPEGTVGRGRRLEWGNGVRGAEGAETKTSRSEALKAPRRDAVNVQGQWNGEGFPLPDRLVGLGRRRELPHQGPKTDFSAFQASQNGE